MKRTYLLFSVFAVGMILAGMIAVRLLTSGPFQKEFSRLGRGDSEFRKARQALLLSAGDPGPALVDFALSPRVSERARIQALTILRDYAIRRPPAALGAPLASLLDSASPALQAALLETMAAMNVEGGRDRIAELFASTPDTLVRKRCYAVLRNVNCRLADSIRVAGMAGNDSLLHRYLHDVGEYAGCEPAVYRAAATLFRERGDSAAAVRWEAKIGAISRWWMAGAFDNSADGFEREFGPERAPFSLLSKFDVKKGELPGWRIINYADRNGYVRFDNMYEGCCHVAYVFTYIVSPDTRDAFLFMGHDEPARAWMNDSLIYASLFYGISEPDRFVVPVRLREGVNRLLVKSIQDLSGWRVAVRLGDARGEVIPDIRVCLDTAVAAIIVQPHTFKSGRGEVAP